MQISPCKKFEALTWASTNLPYKTSKVRILDKVHFLQYEKSVTKLVMETFIIYSIGQLWRKKNARKKQRNLQCIFSYVVGTASKLFIEVRNVHRAMKIDIQHTITKFS